MIALAVACWIVGTTILVAPALANRAHHRRRLMALRAAYHEDKLRSVTPYIGPTFNTHGRACEPHTTTLRRVL